MTRLERVVATVATLVAAVLVLTDAVPLLRGPAPYPPEWQWLRRGEAPDAMRFVWPLASAALLTGLLALSGGRWFRDRPRRGAAVLLAGATLVGAAFQLGLLGMEPQGALPTLLSRVISRTDTAYYTVAVSDDARAPLAWLDRHAELLLDLRKSAKHAATHPPGPVLYYRAWIATCEASPALTRLVLSTAGLQPGDGPTRRPPHTPASIAGALMGGLFLLALCAAACGPIAVALRLLGRDALGAARLAALWPLVPGAALMSPQLDQALALPVAGTVALLAIAMAAPTPRTGRLAALLAGSVGFLASFLSYGAVAFVAIGVVAIAWALGWKRAPAPLAMASLAALFWLVLTVALGHEPLAAARAAIAFHRETYTAPRSYPLWLGFNPVDFALFLGAPLVALGALRLGRAPAGPPGRYRVALLAGLIVLVLSGTVRGELGRIGVPLMALALPAALADRDLPASDAAWMGSLQAALCVVLRACWILP